MDDQKDESRKNDKVSKETTSCWKNWCCCFGYNRKPENKSPTDTPSRSRSRSHSENKSPTYTPALSRSHSPPGNNRSLAIVPSPSNSCLENGSLAVIPSPSYSCVRDRSLDSLPSPRSLEEEEIEFYNLAVQPQTPGELPPGTRSRKYSEVEASDGNSSKPSV